MNKNLLKITANIYIKCLEGYLSNKELEFGCQVYESEDYVVYNTIIEAIILELVNDGIIVKQQKESTPDDPEDRYEITQNLDKTCKSLRIVVYHFKTP
jgi:hypothetical protein